MIPITNTPVKDRLYMQCARGEHDQPMQSAGIVPESVATPLVGTGSMVGLRPWSASLFELVDAWDDRARSYAHDAEYLATREQRRSQEYSDKALLWRVAASELRRQIAYASERQPEPNK